jgi:hypothetical protein
MKWALGVLLLFLIGVLLRWILRLGRPALVRPGGLAPLGAEREPIFQPTAQEIETQAAILGISLNDAIEERDAGQPEMAWRMVRLAVSEWDRLAEILALLCSAMGRHLPGARAVFPVRSVAAHNFKSRVMVDYVRTHELLDQLVFRPKSRFQLHLRMLRRAAEMLSAEFRRAYRYADRTGDRPPELWDRLDFYFHDFDLVSKETLLAFRALLLCLPHSNLAPLATDLTVIMRHGVRSTTLSADR